MIQAALVISGLATLLQLFPIGKKDGFKVGAALPVIMGVSFAYVPSMQAIAGDESGLGIPMILGAQIVGGVVAIIVGFSIKKIRKLFPPLIAGTVVFTIGLSLSLIHIYIIRSKITKNIQIAVRRRGQLRIVLFSKMEELL